MFTRLTILFSFFQAALFASFLFFTHLSLIGLFARISSVTDNSPPCCGPTIHSDLLSKRNGTKRWLLTFWSSSLCPFLDNLYSPGDKKESISLWSPSLTVCQFSSSNRNMTSSDRRHIFCYSCLVLLNMLVFLHISACNMKASQPFFL